MSVRLQREASDEVFEVSVYEENGEVQIDVAGWSVLRLKQNEDGKFIVARFSSVEDEKFAVDKGGYITVVNED